MDLPGKEKKGEHSRERHWARGNRLRDGIAIHNYLSACGGVDGRTDIESPQQTGGGEEQGALRNMDAWANPTASAKGPLVTVARVGGRGGFGQGEARIVTRGFEMAWVGK